MRKSFGIVVVVCLVGLSLSAMASGVQNFGNLSSNQAGGGDLSAASGGPLNLHSGPPDIASLVVPVSYNSTTEVFTASGGAGVAMFPVNLGGPLPYTLAGATFSLTAIIDNTGSLQPGGTVTITGSALLNPSNTPVQGASSLTGTLTAFGFAPGAGNVFEFTFNTTGGNLQGAPVNFGSQGGIILHTTGSTFLGSFASSFASTAGTADTFAIPTPAAWSAGLLLLAGLVCTRIVRARKLA